MDGSSGSVKFTAQSTLKCPQCLQMVSVGTGGEYNLKQHLGATKCVKAAAKNQQKPPQKTIDNYFSKAAVAVPSTVAAPAPIQGPAVVTAVAAPQRTGPVPQE
ncbi:hypothetical protein C8R44DRAFT_979332 [Mycena epipterygia]|nr:hypothetical protein C8R44DRAFT_979332 [Mycena epipterygia]